MQTADPRKAKDRLLGNMEVINDYHRKMWPGVGIQSHPSKRAKVQPGGELNPDAWFPVRVVSTSMVFAIMAFMISHRARPFPDRAYALQALAELLGKIPLSGQRMTLWFKRLGDDEWICCTCWVSDQKIYVSGRAAWTVEFYNERVASSWELDFKSDQKDWMSNSSGLFDVTLSSLLGFMLDPQHHVDLHDFLQPLAYSLLTQIAAFVESCIGRFLTEFQSEGSTLGGLTRVKKLHDNISWQLRYLMAKRLWNEEDWSNIVSQTELIQGLKWIWCKPHFLSTLGRPWNTMCTWHASCLRKSHGSVPQVSWAKRVIHCPCTGLDGKRCYQAHFVETQNLNQENFHRDQARSDHVSHIPSLIKSQNLKTKQGGRFQWLIRPAFNFDPANCCWVHVLKCSLRQATEHEANPCPALGCTLAHMTEIHEPIWSDEFCMYGKCF